MSLSLAKLVREVKDESVTGGSFMIMQGDNQQFEPKIGSYSHLWRTYCDLVLSREKQLYLAETGGDIAPSIIEFNIIFDTDNTQLSDNFLLGLIYCYQQAIIENIVQPKGDNNSRYDTLCCLFVSDLDRYTDSNGGKISMIRVRIQFPYCRCVSKTREMLKQKAISNLRNKNVLGKLDKQPIGDWPSMINPDIPNKYLPLYGSTVNSTESRLELINIYSDVRWEEDGRLTATTCNIDRHLFDPGSHNQVRDGKIDLTSLIDGRQPDHTYYLPMFFSLNFWPIVSKAMENVSTTSSPRPRSATKLSKKLEDARVLMALFGANTYSLETVWTEVGIALHRISKGSDDGLELWKDYTKERIPSKLDKCDETYPTLNNKHYGIKTLGYYARLDSPDLYKVWHTAWCLPFLEDAAARPTHNTVAKALYKCYWLDYRCPNQANDMWYGFRDHRWRKLDGSDILRRKLSGEMKNKYEILRQELCRQIAQSNSSEFKKLAEQTCKNYTNLIIHLENRTFKNNIIGEAKEFFRDPMFLQLENANQMLTGMEDCVIEVFNDQVIIRPGKPDDYLTMGTGVSLGKGLHANHPSVIKLRSWLRKVYPDEQLYKHFMKFAASCLRSGNPNKLFVIFSGTGDNSKSMIVKLYEAALGNYAIKFPKELLTDDRKSSGPTPELAQARWAKIAFIDEPEEDKELKAGIVKMMTGGDSFFARFLHQDGGKVKSMFKTVLNCNEPPSFPKKQKALTNRVRIFPHLGTWSDNAPATVEEQFKLRIFPKDEEFDLQIPEMAAAFVWEMIQYYPIYFREKLRDPDIVSVTTKQYWDDNDIYIPFKRDCIMKALDEKGNPDLTAKVSVMQAYEEFKDWLKGFNQSKKPEPRDRFEKELIMRWGPLDGDSWTGLRLKQRFSMGF